MPKARLTIPKFPFPNPKMTLDQFVDQYTDWRWVNPEGRPKVVKAFQKLCLLLPDKVWLDAPSIRFFAPDSWHHGMCTQIPTSDPETAFIYLAPSLERAPQAEVDFTVAHEFAHAVLGHHRDNQALTPKEVKEGYLSFNHEKAADRLAKKWGFTIPEYRKGKI